MNSNSVFSSAGIRLVGLFTNQIDFNGLGDNDRLNIGEENLVDRIDSGRDARLAPIRIGVNEAVVLDGNGRNDGTSEVRGSRMTPVSKTVGQLGREIRLVLERHRKQLMVDTHAVDGLLNRLAEPQIADHRL